MGRRLRRWAPGLAIAGVSALGLGMIVAFTGVPGSRPGQPETPGAIAPEDATDSVVLALALKSPERRAEALEELANRRNSPDQARARYLLAVDRIAQGQGGQALPLLEDLEAAYPSMADQVRVQRGIAQRAAGQPESAIATWQTVLEEPQNPAAKAEALYQLGQTQPQYWDRLLAEVPAHPRSVAVAVQRLAATPDSPQVKEWLLLITRHGLHHPEVVSFVDRLVAEYGSQLTPEDWQAVGFAYWEKQIYRAAGEAYSKAPRTPQTLYRAARGMQIGQQRAAAIAGYQALAAEFPDAPETALGLIRLSYLVDTDTALAVLDQVVQRFPDRAAEAWIEKGKLYDSLSSPDTANQARQRVFSDYSESDEAATLRLRDAHRAADAGNWSGAIAWATQVLDQNPNSEEAPEAGFWAAKWMQRAGQSQEAQSYFERVLRDYPESYFAWRSAVALGWEVGDFETVRSLQPAVSLPPQREPLPAGSEALQELYRLGQDEDAWALWQVEFSNPQDPTVEEQFTDGVLRLGVGDNLEGMFMVSSLAWRDDPADQAIYAELTEHPAYWQALYPFPFAEAIARWSAQRQLNPLLVTALIRQESRFEPKIRSAVGATGLMQVMPDTAAWIQPQAGIGDYNLEDPEDSLNLGTWYLDYTHREYGNNSLYAVASYNAGPGNVADWIGRNNYADADEFVHRIPFPETQNYIETVFGGYWNYLRLYNPAIAQRLDAFQR